MNKPTSTDVRSATRNTKECRRIAQHWLELGASPIPILADGSKRSAIKWRLYQKEAASPEEIDKWFSRPRGLGIVTGIGGVELLEFETSVVWWQWCLKMREQGHADDLAALCNGYLARSPSGGYHLIYTTDEPEPNQKLAQESEPYVHYVDSGRNPVETQVLIETRGVGGYVIVAGSDERTHPTGRPYVRESWDSDLFNNIVRAVAGQEHARLPVRHESDPDPEPDNLDIPVPDPAPTELFHVSAELREDMFAAARQLDQPAAKCMATGAGQPAHRAVRGQGVSGVRPGVAFAGATAWAEILEPHGWRKDPTADTEESIKWTRPGKESGTSATTDYEGTGLFYVFTSSTDFEAGRSYDKFAAYALLNHGGDFKSAAKELVSKGFGDPREPITDEGAFEQRVDKRTQDRLVYLEADERARRIRAGQNFREPPELGSLAEQLANPVAPPDFLVDDVFLDRGISLVVAQDKAGKTTLISLDLVKALVEGNKWLRKFPTHLPPDAGVAIWNHEVDASRFQGWMAKANIAPEHLDRVHPMHLRGFPVDLEEPTQEAWAVEWLRERNVKVWIIDPLSKIFLGDTNSDTEFNRWWRALEAVMEQAGVDACIIPHHAGHNDNEDWTPRARGTSAMKGNPDVTLMYRHGGKYGDRPPDSKRYLSAYGRDVDLLEITLNRDPETGVLFVDESSSGRSEDKLEAVGLRLANAVWNKLPAGEEWLSKGDAEKLLRADNKDKRLAFGWCEERGYLRIVVGKRGVAHKVFRGNKEPSAHGVLPTKRSK
ncbi:MAG: hypothetical protein EOP32_22325 [Rhodococcus sp. (in: high G+C Gram-positive bacteria)]|nr:MAG: hypothetical protein EOP32_22325 [Rhodococcus sp. (in: high G+C Gram-positive bacteria)]